MDICLDGWRAPIREAGCRILLGLFFAPRNSRKARAGCCMDFTYSTLVYCSVGGRDALPAQGGDSRKT